MEMITGIHTVTTKVVCYKTWAFWIDYVVPFLIQDWHLTVPIEKSEAPQPQQPWFLNHTTPL
jgi:hypothetical protein